MINSELLKLAAIILGGVTVMGLGAFIQNRMKEQQENAPQVKYEPRLDFDEQKIRAYILQYRENYDKASIKDALVNNAYPEEKIDRMIERFY